MRFSLRSMALAGVLATGLLALGTTPAQAQGYGGGYYGGGGYGQGYGGGGYSRGYGGGYGQGYGGGYAVPTQQYYGNGAHDLQPHEHTNSAYGGYRGYSPSPFGGVTTSYYNSTPYTYMPW